MDADARGSRPGSRAGRRTTLASASAVFRARSRARARMQVEHRRRARVRGGLAEILVEAERRATRRPSARSATASSRSSRTVERRAERARAGTRSRCRDTSPSPWRACPSPAEKSAPSTGIGRKSVVPATSSLQSMFPPQRRGGTSECSPGSGGRHADARRGRGAARPRARPPCPSARRAPTRSRAPPAGA